MNVLSLLVTGPQAKMEFFYFATLHYLNAVAVREGTIHYKCAAEYFEAAKRTARDTDVTLQEIVSGAELQRQEIALGNGASCTVTYHAETYPVINLGSDGMGWRLDGAAK